VAAVRCLLAIFLSVLLASSFGAAAIAHGAEPIGCIDKTEAAFDGHTSGDSDERPADGEKGYAHHHGSCHGHQIGEPSPYSGFELIHLNTSFASQRRTEVLASAESESDLRPPIA